MRVKLAYGKDGHWLDLPDRGVTVIAPRHAPPLPDETAAIHAALRAPLAGPPLRDLARPGAAVAVVFSDGTRAQPRDRVLPPLLDELRAAGVAPERITLFNATGTHRANTDAELREMLGPAVAERYRIVQHDARDPASLADAGGGALLNAEFLRAGLKILTGFIEPHFFAGFTGGPKAIMPGLAGLPTILANHGPRRLDEPNATWGVTVGNPVWEEMRDIALRARPDFLLDVALDSERRMTGVFAGELLAAHAAGTRFVARTALAPVPAPFDVVITSNSGWPLDRNVYQAVKGMAAAARVVKPGGAIVIAAECGDGVPEGGFARLMRESSGPAQILARLRSPGFAHEDQWQAQILARILQRAEVHLYSERLDPDTVRSLHLEPCDSIEATVAAQRAHRGPGTTVGILPEGPLTIPVLSQALDDC